MDQPQPPSRSGTIAIGGLTAAMGLYIVLMSVDVVPLPADSLHGPPWIGVCAGLAFVLGGVAVAANAVAGAREDGELPPEASSWLRVAQSALAVGVLACLAAIGTWIAIGGGPRAFSVSGPIDSSHVGAGIGRIIFGIGAVLTWFAAIAFGVRAARRLAGHRKV